MRELILPCQRACFLVMRYQECLSWSRKLSCSERGQYLDGWPLHVTSGGSVVTLVFGGDLFKVEPLWSSGPLWPWWDEDSSRYERGFVRGRRWLSSWTADAVAKQVSNIQREHTSSFGAKLPWEGGSVADSIRGNFYCLARELAFWWCGRVSLLITQVKLQRAWSVFGWLTATRYIYKHGIILKGLSNKNNPLQECSKFWFVLYLSHL
jgi:hypothetical protein